jgi:predicted anti-sigma-YlaC factor YlaD
VERLALALHLAICRNCRRFRRRLAFLAEALRRLASSAAPATPSASASLSADARRRIEEALRQG